MDILKKNIELLLLLSLAAVPFIPTFRALDAVGPHMLYLSLSQIVIFTYLFFSKKKSFEINSIHLCYFGFLILSLLSFFSASNIPEFIIDYTRYINFFISFLIINFLFQRHPDFKKVFYIIFISLSVIESLYIFKIFLKNYSFETGLQRIRDLQGFSYNQNIGAFSLATKLPILLYVIIKDSNLKRVLPLFIVTPIIVFDLLIIGSRGALIALVLMFISLCFLLFSQKYFSLDRFHVKKIVGIISIFIVTLAVQNILYQNSENLKFANRVSNYEDQSIDYRISYYKNAIKGIIDQPFLGFGVGNWKIISLKYQGPEIISYTVPYHVHNDFLQIGAESGIITMIFYVLIFLTAAYFLIKDVFQNKDILSFMLLVALGVFLLDSNVNFPRARPYSQMNIIYLLGFISAFKIRSIKKSIQITRVSLIPLFFLSIVSLPINYKVFESLKEQVALYGDFNFFQTNMRTPIKIVEGFQEDFPNITTVCIPLKIAKAQYYIQNKDFEKAEKYLREGKVHNPYLYLTEFGMSKIHLEKKNYDSAYYYGKIALKGLPKNTSHSTHFQQVLGALKSEKSLIELDSLFKIQKEDKLQATWQNHLWLTSYIKSTKKIPFSEYDKKISEEGIKFFPNNEVIKLSHQMINLGTDIMSVANKFDKIANEQYDQGLYDESIKNWEYAIQSIPNDHAYHLNIAQSLIQLKKYEKAFDKLNYIKREFGDIPGGKLELLKSTIYLFQNDMQNACATLQMAIQKGNAQAQQSFLALNCI